MQPPHESSRSPWQGCPAPRDEPSRKGEAMKQKLLLIEDDDHSRLSIFRYLCEKGYAVTVTSDPPLAEAEVLERQFHAVILAVNVADGKASHFIKGIRSRDPLLPIF